MFGNYDSVPGEVVNKRNSPEPDPLLAQALQFDRDDLTANRAGWLTVRQETHLTEQQRTAQRWMITFGGAAIGVAVSWSLASTLADIQVELLVLGAVLILFALVQLLSIVQVHFQNWQALGIDVEVGAVASISGPVVLSTQPNASGPLSRLRGSATTYMISVAGSQFQVAQQVYTAFRNTDYYTVYYTPQSRQVLSAEVIAV